MDNRSKNLIKPSFKPNLGYKRNVTKDSDPQSKVDVKLENVDNLNPQTSKQKQKKLKEKSTVQTLSVFSNMSSTRQERLNSSRVEFSSGVWSHSNQCSVNNSGLFVKTEPPQSISQMQNILDNNEFDLDDPMNDMHGPVRLPFLKKDKITQVKSENSLEYPFQKNIYPSINELMVPESLTTLQFYDSSFSTEPKITDIDLTKNGDNNTPFIKTKTEIPIKMEYNGHNDICPKTEPNDITNSQPIGKVQYYRSGRVVLIFNGKEYELLKANEDKHHKELFSLTKIEETERPDKLVSLGTVPVRLKAVIDINSIINNFLKNKN